MRQSFRAKAKKSGISLRIIILITTVTVLTTLLFAAFPTQPGDSGTHVYKTPDWAAFAHLTTVLPSIVIGGFILRRKKGGQSHRAWGRVWMSLMATTALVSFWIRAPHGELRAIHIFSVGTLIAIPVALWRIKERDVEGHRLILVSLYIGLIVAGAFALAPDRELGYFIRSVFNPD